VTQQLQPVRYPVFSKDRARLRGREAWKNNLQLASLAASKLASSLGPAGAYKLVTYRLGPELVTKVTKDAVEIVNELGVQYPAIKTLVEAAKIQREEAGDGVSTLLVLISALLTEADRLIEMGVHPVAILDGYKDSVKKCLTIIDDVAEDPGSGLEENISELVDCGRGLLSKRFRSELSQAINLVDQAGKVDVSRIKIERKVGGTVDDSKLVRGVIIKKGKAHRSMPDEISSPKVAVVYNMEIKPLEVIDKKQGPLSITVNIASGNQLRMFISEENRMRARLVEKVKTAGANVLISRAKLTDQISDKLSRADIFAVQMVEQKDIDEVAQATGANIVADINDISDRDIGTAERLEIDKIPPEDVVILHCKGAATLLLRGSSPELVNELEKIVSNALLVLKLARAMPKVVPGGGALFVELALQLRRFALTFAGRQQLAVSAFADAVETIPKWLATNFGLDPIDTMIQLRRDHVNNMKSMGVGEQGSSDMLKENIVELAAINKATFRRTFEVASLLLKIDDYFYVKDLPVFHKH
jgi:chaperonin GroEL (HSP60 family)